MNAVTHYQVTDSLSLCDSECYDGTTVDKRVTCSACLAILATY